jgi:glycosyltransferase involved in cell wall biosynthesis
MSRTRVTVTIPTYNRSVLLKVSLKSVLAQDYPDFQVVILDNASSDDTEAVVRSFADSRITYVRNKTNIGLFRNWNLAIELNSSPYLSILADDDVMLPGFIRESVLVLEKHTRAALSVARARTIGINGAPIDVNARYVPDFMPEGIVDGLEFLHRIVAGHKWIIHFSSVMLRSSALALVGPFDIPHSKDTFDFNLCLRLAAQFDIVFIPKDLCKLRAHPGQESKLHYDSDMGTGALAVMAERIDAIGYLMLSPRAEDVSYRKWLAERLLDLSICRSQLTHQLVPTLNLTWAERLQITRQEITTLIPAGKSFILVDQNQWGSGIVTGRHAIPFIERDGQYWGPPQNDETAIRELKRLQQSGANFIVFGWPAFWWLDYYVELRDYISSQFRCVLKNSRLVVFELQT